MNANYNKIEEITSSKVDVKHNIRYDTILNIFQDLATAHATQMGMSFTALKENSNAFWVLTKSKFKTLNTPHFSEEVTIETWPLPVTPVRFNREYKISLDGEDCGLGTREWVTLDATTKTLRKSSTIKYPFDLEHRTDLSGAGEYSRKREQLSKDNFYYTHTVRYVDIDPNGHTNNVSYVKMALNSFSVEEFTNANFTEFEIQFIAQSYYGDDVDVYKVKTDYGYYVEGKTDGKTTFICILK